MIVRIPMDVKRIFRSEIESNPGIDSCDALMHTKYVLKN
mgnify:CR=1 FL=1